MHNVFCLYASVLTRPHPQQETYKLVKFGAGRVSGRRTSPPQYGVRSDISEQLGTGKARPGGCRCGSRGHRSGPIPGLAGPHRHPRAGRAPRLALTALLAGRGAALAAVRAQEVAGQVQVLEVGEGDEGAGHAPGAAAAAQPGNARALPPGPARPRAPRMRRSRATGEGGAGGGAEGGGKEGGRRE